MRWRCGEVIFLLVLLMLVFGATPALAQPEDPTDIQGTVTATAAGEVDTTPPVIRSVWVEPEIVAPEEKITIYVEVSA